MVYVKHETVVTGDVWRMHLLPENAGALFQLASQFNLLEMTGPEVPRENGVVTIYQHDHTQGPACAIRRNPRLETEFPPIISVAGGTGGTGGT
jgi:hypothetical protein